MLRLTLAGVRGHLVRFLLTAAAVTLGVSLVAGTYVLTDSIKNTFNGIVEAGTQGVDVQIRGRESEAGTNPQSGAQGTGRVFLPLSLEEPLRAADGVARVVPDIAGSGIIVGKDGTPVRNGGAPTFVFAFVPDDPSLTLVRGRGPREAGEVAVESTTLERSGLSVGATTRALVGDRPQDVTIVGEVAFDTGLAGATILLVDEATARADFARDGLVQSFSVTADPGVSQEQLRSSVLSVVPFEAEVVTGEDLRAENREQIEEGLGFVNRFLQVFALISLFVGAFIIFNTFSMLVAQRTRELALLRAIGASRTQVRSVVVGEALVVGLAGSAIGIGVGVGLAALLQQLVSSFGLQISGGLPVAPRTVIVSMLLGTVITVVAAVLPAFRAARIAPVAAMRDDVALAPRGLRFRGIVGAVLMGAGLLVLVPAVRAEEIRWLVVAAGAALLVIGTLVAAPVATRPVVRVIAAPFVLMFGTVGRLARENSLRNPRRTAVTATALMIGLALIGAVGVLASSATKSVAGIIESEVQADYVLTAGNAPVPAGAADAVGKIDGVRYSVPVSPVAVKVGAGTTSAYGIDRAGLDATLRVTMISGATAALERGEILLSESQAEESGVSTGEQVPVTIGTSAARQVTVGGVYQDSQFLGPVLVNREAYEAAVPQSQRVDVAIVVKAEPGTDAAALRTPIVDAVKPFLVVSVQDADEFTASQADQVNQVLAILYGLLALSVVIAVLGIVNTLALSVFERTREIGLLRAVGLSRRQLRRMINIESVSTAVFGALLGTVLGIGLGVAVQHALRGEGLTELAIPWGTIVAVLLASVVAGFVAAVLPAWRAVRLDVLRAITTE